MSIPETRPSDGASMATDSHQQHLHNLKNEATATLEDVKNQGADQYEHLRDLATGQMDSLAEGAQSAAAALQGHDSLGLSQYLGQLASGLGSFADQVRDKSAEDLLHKGAQLARDNPALFLAGSVAIGFGLSRFLRASASHGQSQLGTSSAQSPSAQPVGLVTTPAIDDYSANADAAPSTGAVADPLGDAATYPAIGTQPRGAE
jgi:hypothetical protein